jgi:ubiquitin C-terminal hydrolase
MHTFVNLAINDDMIETGKCSLQQLVLETYGKNRDLDEGAKCVNCSKEERVSHSEVTKLTYDTPSDIIFVVKKISYKNNQTEKLLIEIACDDTINIPYWEETSLKAELDLEENLEMTYNLRGVVCHDGSYYDSGHYRTLRFYKDWETDSVS